MKRTDMLQAPTPRTLNLEDSKAIREVFANAGYTESAVRERSGLLVPPPAELTPPSVLEAFADQDDLFCCLAQLFFLGRTLDSAVARKTLPASFLRLCCRCGLLEEHSLKVTPRSLVIPVGDYLMASDLQTLESQDKEGYVPTLCDAALHLSAVSIRQPVKRVLDLCGGYSLHGMMACEYAENVYSTDVNPRAEFYARFNASLNGYRNLTAVTGDMLSAVRGKKFDLILSNPPFIISPESLTSYRFNPLELDGFVRTMFQAIPDYLEDGGYFQTICEWVETEDEDPEERLRGWFLENGCDVWVLPANRQLPSTYAAATLRQSTTDRKELLEKQAEWEAYFAEKKVKAIQGGFIFMRRRNGANWFDVTQLTKPIRQQIGDAVRQGFQTRDLLFDPSGDAAILNSRLTVAKGTRMVDESSFNGVRWENNSMVLHVDEGIPVSIGIDQYVRSLLAKFDGSLCVADCLESFSNQVGLPLESGFAQGLQITKAMMRTGVLCRQGVRVVEDSTFVNPIRVHSHGIPAQSPKDTPFSD